MKALLWKDYRVNRVVLIVAVVILFGPLFAATVVNAIGQIRHGATVNWFEVIEQVAGVTLACSLVTASLLGANAFAGERADRSAEFMAYLPPTRARKLLSKTILAFSAATFVTAVILFMAYVLAPFVGEATTHTTKMRGDLMDALVPAAVLMFGAAWCASSVMSSPTFAAGIGFFAPWALYTVLAIVAYWIKVEGFDIQFWWIATATTTGVLAFLTGCGCYLKRIEP